MKYNGTNNSDHPAIFHGLADAFGLHSLTPYNETETSTLIMRANIYRHRHSLYFQVKIDEPIVHRVKTLMDNGHNESALNLLKDRAKVIFIPKEFLDSWELIPDQRLDPYKTYIT